MDSSRKILLLALMLSLALHLGLVLFAGRPAHSLTPSDHADQSQTVTLQTGKIHAPAKVAARKWVWRQRPVHQYQSASPQSTPQSNPADPSPSDEQTGQILPAYLPRIPLPDSLPPMYDTPAELVTDLDEITLEDIPLEIDPSRPLIVVQVWIDRSGVVSRIDVLESQLDSEKAGHVLAQLRVQRYHPALKDKQAVESSKLYALSAQGVVVLDASEPDSEAASAPTGADKKGALVP